MSAAHEGRADAGARSLRLTRAEWLLLLVLGAVQFTHIVDFVLLMPLAPQLERDLHVNTQQFGVLVSAYGFGAGVSGLVVASLLDRFDRKRTLLALYAGFTAATLCCAAAPDYVTLVAARALAGAFGGVVAAAVLAIVGDAVPVTRRGAATGVVMSAFSVASIAGVPAGLVLAEGSALGWRTPFAVLGVLGVGMLLLGAWVLPPVRGHLSGQRAGLWAVLSEPAHWRAFALMAALVLTTFTVVPYLAPYLVKNVGLDPKTQLPLVYVVGGVATLLAMQVVGKLSDRFSRLRVFRVLGLLTAVPLVLMTNLPPVHLVTALTVTTLFMILTSGRMVPAMALITGSAAPRYRGTFLSINSSVQQLAAGVAPLLAAALLRPGAPGAPLEGFPAVGAVAVGFAVVSVVLAGQVRPAVE